VRRGLKGWAFVPVLAVAVLLAGCQSGARDPGADRSNIFGAAAGAFGGGYEKHLNQKREAHAEAVAREKRSEKDNLILKEGLSESEAEKRVLSDQVKALTADVQALERKAQSVKADSDSAKKRMAVLEARRAELDTEADRILSGGGGLSEEEQSEQLANLEAERRMLLDEYDTLQRE